MRKRVSAPQMGRALVVLAAAVAGASPAMATTLRIAEYNIDDSDQGNNNNINGSSPGVPTILQAMGVHKLGTNAQPIDILALTEMLDTNNNSITSTTLPAIVTVLNNIYGAGTYAYVNTPDATSGGTQFNGPSGYVYNTKTVQCLGAASLLYSGNSSNSNPRAPFRAEFQPIGYGANSDFYMYVSHMKSGTSSTDVNERAQEATIIRNDEATLPTNSSVIYTGDYNSNPPEAEFTILTGAGQGQAFDPENFTTSNQYWSESTSKLQYRDDYEMMTTNVLSDTGPLDYVTGSFQVFGNNGTTGANGATNSGSNTALGDLSNRTTVLNDLMQPPGSDHMPVEADYGVGVSLANLTWNNAGATGTNDGITWDVDHFFNWNNGSNATAYLDGCSVTFNDTNSTHYTVTLNTTVKPGSVTVNNSSGTYSISGSGTIAGSGSFTKSGTGMLLLSTANTFSGGLNLDNGLLNFANIDNLGTSTVGFAGGTLQYASGNTADISTLPVLLGVGGGTIDTMNNTVALNNSIGDGGAGGLTKAGTGKLTLNAVETYTGGTTVTGGTLEIGSVGGIVSSKISVSSPGVFTVDAGGAIPSSANVTVNGTYNENNPTRTINTLNGSGTVNLNATALTVTGGGTFSGAIDDNATGGSLVSAGGTLVLSGTNVYTGGTTISSGTLRTGSAGALGTGPVAVNSPGVLDLGGNGPTAGNLSGSGTVDNVSAGGTATLGINTTTSSNFSGTIQNTAGVVAVTVGGTGTQIFSGINTYSGNTTVNGGTLVEGVAGALPASANLAVNNTGTAQLAAGIGGQSLSGLSVAPNAIFDINNNHVFINYGSPGNDPISSVISWIDNAALDGQPAGSPVTWTGTGITSSFLNTTIAGNSAGSYGIGYADSADPGNPAQLAPNQVEIMYTLLGDANLDGKVNGTDFNILAANFNTGGDSWDQGDFTYDGKVNGSDFNLLAANFNQGATQAADLSALDSFAAANGISLANVPEPAVVGLLLPISYCLLGKRRRAVRERGE